MVLVKRSRDHRTHGIVANSMANPMRALPGLCGASLGSESPPKGQKYVFGTRNHLFREFSRNSENRNSKNFGHEPGGRLFWASRTDLRPFGRLAAAGSRIPASSVYERLTYARNPDRDTAFGDCDFSAVCTRQMHRATCGPGDGAQKDPPGARSTLGGAAESPCVATGTGD